MAKACRKSDSSLGCEILRRHRADKTHKSQKRHDGDHVHNMAFVPQENAAVNDGGDDQRDDQFKGRFKKLEERAEHALPAVALEIDEEFLQEKSTFSYIVYVCYAHIIGGAGANCNGWRRTS